MKQTEIHFEESKWKLRDGSIHVYKMPSSRRLELIIKALKDILATENKLDYMYRELPFWADEKIEEAIGTLEFITEYDPTDEICDGEPPITAAEMASASWKQHLEFHS
jgi:hypothetical protein